MKGKFLIGFLLLFLVESVIGQQMVRMSPSRARYTNTPSAQFAAATNGCTVYSVTVRNTGSSDLYLLVVDRAATLTNGVKSSTPPLTITAGACGGWDWAPVGRTFTNGVRVGCSTSPLFWTNAGGNVNFVYEAQVFDTKTW